MNFKDISWIYGFKIEWRLYCCLCFFFHWLVWGINTYSRKSPTFLHTFLYIISYKMLSYKKAFELPKIRFFFRWTFCFRLWPGSKKDVRAFYHTWLKTEEETLPQIVRDHAHNHKILLKNFHELTTETENLIGLSCLPVGLKFDFRLNKICVGILFLRFLFLSRVLFQCFFFNFSEDS